MHLGAQVPGGVCVRFGLLASDTESNRCCFFPNKKHTQHSGAPICWCKLPPPVAPCTAHSPEAS